MLSILYHVLFFSIKTNLNLTQNLKYIVDTGINFLKIIVHNYKKEKML